MLCTYDRTRGVTLLLCNVSSTQFSHLSSKIIVKMGLLFSYAVVVSSEILVNEIKIKTTKVISISLTKTKTKTGLIYKTKPCKI